MDFVKANFTKTEILNILDLYSFSKVGVYIEELEAIANNNYHVQNNDYNVVIKGYSHGQSEQEKIEKEIEAVNIFLKNGIMTPIFVKGIDGKILQSYKGFNIVVSEFIAGNVFDKVTFTKDRMIEVGSITAKLSKVASTIDIQSFECMSFAEEFDYVKKNLDFEIESRGYKYDYSIFTKNQNLINKIIMKLDNTKDVQFLHKDIWPWNLIESNDCTYLLDFNDWSIGPSIIEVAVPILEFAMFKSNIFNTEVARNILDGYSRETTIKFTSKDLWETMLFICFLYFPYNVIQASSRFESEIYLKRIKTLLDNPDLLKNIL